MAANPSTFGGTPNMGLEEVHEVVVEGVQSDEPVQQNSIDVTPLAKLNDDAARLIYTSLMDDEIRLVTIHSGAKEDNIECSVYNVKQTSNTKYEALSYVWGSQTNLKSINVNGKEWMVTRNLESILRQLRRPMEDRVMWIDALAVNQSDIPERNSQVMKMRDFYFYAQSTVISLTYLDQSIPGEDWYLNLLFGLMAGYTRDQRTSADLSYLQELEEAHQRDLLTALFLCKQLPYWERVWIIQEVMYSNDVSICYAGEVIPYAKFFEFWVKASEELQLTSRGDVNMEFAWRMIKTQGPHLLPPLGSASRGEYMSLSHWYENHTLTKATDPRDKIFGFYGCLSPEIRERVEIDYAKTQKEVLISFVQTVIDTWKRIDIILECVSYSRAPSLPSWVPDLLHNAQDLHLCIPYRSLRKHPRFSSSAGGEGPSIYNFHPGMILKAKGACIATVIETGILSFNPESEDEDNRALNLSWKGGPQAFRTFLEYFYNCWQALGLQVTSGGANAFISAFFSPFGFSREELMKIKLALLFQEKSILDFIMEIHWEAVSCLHKGRRMFTYYRSYPSDVNGGRIGGFGIGGYRMRSGDKVCVLFGCAMPVVLRQVGVQHILIGDAYMKGFMSGEGIGSIERGELEAEEFHIK